MKIGIISYPALWQRKGGLQIQIDKTCAALNNLGVETKVVNFVNEKLDSYDLIHSFSAAHGLYAVVEEAKAQGVRVVVSPVLQPEQNLNKFLLYRLLNKATLWASSSEIKTSYGQIRSVLRNAHKIVALSSREMNVISQGYGIDKDKVTIIPNGIDEHFFQDTIIDLPSDLRQLEGYVFVSGSISTYKNQLAVIEATERPVVLAGPAYSPEYLKKCLHAGGSRVHYVGVLQHHDPMLVSLYRNAAVNVLASFREAGPLCSLEALACGTPAVVTKKNGLPMQAQPPLLQYVDANDRSALAHAIELAAKTSFKDRTSCQSIVAELRWDSVARSILPIYESLMHGRT